MPTVSIASLLRDNDPTSLTVVSDAAVRIPGALVTTVPNVPLTITKGKSKMRWRQASKFVRGMIAGRQMSAPADAPTISSVSPASSANDTTTVITITGTGFEVSAVAKLVSAAGVVYDTDSSTRVSATSITFKVPGAVPAGVYGVRVTDANMAVTKPASLTVAAATVSSLGDGTVANDNVETVAVTGTGFGDGVAVALIDALGAVVAIDNLVRVSATSLTFTVPGAVDAGTYSVRVTNPGATPVLKTGLTVTAA